MSMMNFQVNYVGQNITVHCLEGTDEFIRDGLAHYPKYNGGMDNLVGTSSETANILFVHQNKLHQVKDVLDKLVMLQPEDILEDDNIDNVFHYLEFPCKDAPYSIIVFDQDLIEDNCIDYENNYETIHKFIDEANNLSDCLIYAGAAFNDYYVFNIMDAHLHSYPELKNVDYSDLPGYEKWNSMMEGSSQGDYMSINKNNPTLDDAIYFYKLVMDNLYMHQLNNLKAQNRNVDFNFYTYEKVNRYLERK